MQLMALESRCTPSATLAPTAIVGSMAPAEQVADNPGPLFMMDPLTGELSIYHNGSYIPWVGYMTPEEWEAAWLQSWETLYQLFLNANKVPTIPYMIPSA